MYKVFQAGNILSVNELCTYFFSNCTTHADTSRSLHKHIRAINVKLILRIHAGLIKYLLPDSTFSVESLVNM